MRSSGSAAAGPGGGGWGHEEVIVTHVLVVLVGALRHPAALARASSRFAMTRTKRRVMASRRSSWAQTRCQRAISPLAYPPAVADGPLTPLASTLMVGAVTPLALAHDLPLIPMQEPWPAYPPCRTGWCLHSEMHRCLSHLAVLKLAHAPSMVFRFVRECAPAHIAPFSPSGPAARLDHCGPSSPRHGS